MFSLAAAGAAAVDAQERFRSAAEAVRLDVLVTDGRKPIRGLTAADFDVKDSGTPQQIRVEPAAGAVDVILTLDVSDSLSAPGLAALKAAAREVIGLLAPADRIQIITFNHLVTLRSPLDSSRASSLAALDDLAPAGGTALRDAAFAALMSVPAHVEDRRTVQLILSDGDDSASWLSDTAVRTALRRSAVVVYALAPARPSAAQLLATLPAPVPAGSRPTRVNRTFEVMPTGTTGFPAGFLHDAARDTGGRAVYVDNPEATASMFREVLEEFRERYVITFTPTSDAKGWHPLTVTVKGRRGASVFARRGYYRDQR
jgi:VWFA-related protein